MAQANNHIVQTKTQPGFTATISGAAVQKMINTALHDPRRAASFTSTLISLVNSNKKLQECEPASIISAALRGEAMNLSLALNQYSVVPYGKSANFQLSYKGLAQLATRSGQYHDFGVCDVRAGEYAGKDPLTRRPSFNWIDDDDEREKLPIIGYYGYYELQNGFFKGVYWTHDKILSHANRYSKAFDKDRYERLIMGKLNKDDIKSVTRQWDRTAPSQEEAAARIREGSPWYDDPDSEAHMKMCRKTVLIQMLGDGTAPLSLEMSKAIKEDQLVEQGGEFISDDDPRVVANVIKRMDKLAKDMNPPVDVETGEIVDSRAVIDVPAIEQEPVTKKSKEPNYDGYKKQIEKLTDDTDSVHEQIVLDENGQMKIV